MPPALQQPAALVPAKISLEQYHRMVDVGGWDDRHVELLGLRKANVLLVAHE